MELILKTRPFFLAAVVVCGSISFSTGLLSAQGSRYYGYSADSTVLTVVEHEWHPTAAQVFEIQLLLRELGFNPGAPDGTVGPRTTAAIKDFQRSINAQADGQLTKDVYKQIIEAFTLVDQSPESKPRRELLTQSVPTDSQTLESQFGCLSAASSVWEIEDVDGGKLTLILRRDGSVEGPSFPEHWRWQPTEEGIEINYDNRMGMTVTRRGRLEGSSLMVGEAADSRERSWTWKAERVQGSPNSNNSDCIQKDAR